MGEYGFNISDSDPGHLVTPHLASYLTFLSAPCVKAWACAWLQVPCSSGPCNPTSLVPLKDCNRCLFRGRIAARSRGHW